MASKPVLARAITFDGDGTLWDFDKVMRNSLTKVLEELQRMHQKDIVGLTVDKLIEIRDGISRSLKGTTLNLEEVRLEAFRETLREIGKPDESLAVHLNEIYFKHRFASTELYEDTLHTLSSLKDQYVIGLLSNGNNDPSRFGLNGLFNFTIFAAEVGLKKPDPRIFSLAASRAGFPPKEMLHVGDSLDEDVAGAKSIGMIPVWINRTGRKSQGLEVDYEIVCLRELLGLLSIDSKQVS